MQRWGLLRILYDKFTTLGDNFKLEKRVSINEQMPILICHVTSSCEGTITSFDLRYIETQDSMKFIDPLALQ